MLNQTEVNQDESRVFYLIHDLDPDKRRKELIELAYSFSQEPDTTALLIDLTEDQEGLSSSFVQMIPCPLCHEKDINVLGQRDIALPDLKDLLEKEAGSGQWSVITLNLPQDPQTQWSQELIDHCSQLADAHGSAFFLLANADYLPEA